MQKKFPQKIGPWKGPDTRSKCVVTTTPAPGTVIGGPRYGPFFGKNQFSPADEAVLMGLVVRKCTSPISPFSPLGQPARFARRLENDK